MATLQISSSLILVCVLPFAIVLSFQSIRLFVRISAAYLKVFPSSHSTYKAPFLTESDNCLHVFFLEGADILFFHFVHKLNVSSQIGVCCITACNKLMTYEMCFDKSD